MYSKVLPLCKIADVCVCHLHVKSLPINPLTSSIIHGDRRYRHALSLNQSEQVNMKKQPQIGPIKQDKGTELDVQLLGTP